MHPSLPPSPSTGSRSSREADHGWRVAERTIGGRLRARYFQAGAAAPGSRSAAALEVGSVAVEETRDSVEVTREARDSICAALGVTRDAVGVAIAAAGVTRDAVGVPRAAVGGTDGGARHVERRPSDFEGSRHSDGSSRRIDGGAPSSSRATRRNLRVSKQRERLDEHGEGCSRQGESGCRWAASAPRYDLGHATSISGRHRSASRGSCHGESCRRRSAASSQSMP